MTAKLRPSLTIITPSYNQVAYLSELLLAMDHTTNEGFRHIVIDGGSTDGTVDLLRTSRRVEWYSGPDNGQADAINIGLRMADTDLVGWINCDDRYVPGALDFVRSVFGARPDIAFIYGDVLAVDSKKRSYGLRAHVRSCDLDHLVFRGDPIVQPAAIWRTELAEQVGLLDSTLTYAFDYEYWMRIAAVTDLVYVPMCLAIESMHGAAKTSRGGRHRIAEIAEVAERHGGEGIPKGFRAEAGAIETVQGMRAAGRGDLASTRASFAHVHALRPPLVRYAAHLFAETLPGTGTLPRLRLLANLARSRRKPTWPTEPATAEVLAQIVATCPKFNDRTW